MARKNMVGIPASEDRRTEAEVIRIYGMPQHTQEVPGMTGKTLTFSELCMHCEAAGQPVSRLFKAPWDYGYALLEDGRMVHGSLHVCGDTISLS